MPSLSNAPIADTIPDRKHCNAGNRHFQLYPPNQAPVASSCKHKFGRAPATTRTWLDHDALYHGLESEMNDGSNALALVHQIKGAIDVLEWHRVGNEFVDLQFSVHVLIDHSW